MEYIFYFYLHCYSDQHTSLYIILEALLKSDNWEHGIWTTRVNHRNLIFDSIRIRCILLYTEDINCHLDIAGLVLLPFSLVCIYWNCLYFSFSCTSYWLPGMSDCLLVALVVRTTDCVDSNSGSHTFYWGFFGKLLGLTTAFITYIKNITAPISQHCCND